MRVESLDQFTVISNDQGFITTGDFRTDVFGLLADYENPLGLAKNTTVIYGTDCYARAGSQTFRGPALLSNDD